MAVVNLSHTEFTSYTCTKVFCIYVYNTLSVAEVNCVCKVDGHMWKSVSWQMIFTQVVKVVTSGCQ